MNTPDPQSAIDSLVTSTLYRKHVDTRLDQTVDPIHELLADMRSARDGLTVVHTRLLDHLCASRTPVYVTRPPDFPEDTSILTCHDHHFYTNSVHTFTAAKVFGASLVEGRLTLVIL